MSLICENKGADTYTVEAECRNCRAEHTLRQDRGTLVRPGQFVEFGVAYTFKCPDCGCVAVEAS